MRLPTSRIDRSKYPSGRRNVNGDPFRTSPHARSRATARCHAGSSIAVSRSVSPAIREACEASILGHAAKLEADVAAAIELHRTPSGVMARSLALHMQAVLQGAFILAKAKGDAAVAAESIDHLRRYLVLLFRGHSARR
jgi:TetR/AcrR family transcriptional regulator, transcriptional repressor for nem operon